MAFLGKAFGNLIGRNVTPKIAVSTGGRVKNLQVKPAFLKRQQRHHEMLMNKWKSELGSVDGGFGVGQLESEMGGLIHEAHFNAGVKEARRLKSTKGPVHGMVAGSGNDIIQALKLAKTMTGRKRGIVVGTTGGGWLQNISRIFKSPMFADQGALNASMQHGMMAEFAKQTRRKVVSASFSQGSHAASESMSNLGSRNLQALDLASHVTMGGSAYLPLKHVAMMGKFDPVPLAKFLALPGKKGQVSAEYPNISHSGIKYAKAFKRLNASKPPL